MTKRERVVATISGRAPDRVPISFWRHFPDVDQNANALADAMIAFQRTYDLDLVKLMPNGMYGTEDFGCQIGNPDPVTGAKRLVESPIRNAGDLDRLTGTDATRGARGRELECLRTVRAALGPDIPIIQTVFSPLTTAAKMVTPVGLVEMLRAHPAEVHRGLEAITRTEERFVAACMDIGAAGVFFATQMAQMSVMTKDEYEGFGRPYDVRVLAAAGPDHVSVVHVHGIQTYFSLFANYPAPLVNWHDRRASPGLHDAQALMPGRAVMGGLDERGILLLGPASLIARDVHATLQRTGSRRHLLAPGCVLPLDIPAGHLMAARTAVDASA